MDWTTSIHDLDDPEAQRRWEALWETSPQRSSFSSLAYARAATTSFDLRCEVHLVTGASQVEAAAIVCWRRRGPYRQVVIPPFTQYSPLLLRQPPRETDVHHRRSAFDALLTSLEERFHVLRFFCPHLPDVRAGLWRGWDATPFYTYRMHLQEDDGMQAQWSSTTKRTFRKEQDAFRVGENTVPPEVTVSLCAAGYQRHGRPLPADHARLLDLVNALQANGSIRHFTAAPLGARDVEAGIIVLHDERTAHYWIAGSEPGPAMTVLLGRLLPILREDGIQTFDFVGANTPSIAEFKRRFGSTLSPYYLLEYISRPELRLWNALRR